MNPPIASENNQVNRQNILEAPARLFEVPVPPLRRTPLLQLAGSTLGVDCAEVWFKLEQLQACIERAVKTGAMLVHAYDQIEVVAGAGTLALEIEDQAGLPDAVLVSVGGGGLIAGLAAGFESRTQVVALESDKCPTLFEARRQGYPVDGDVGGIAADPLAARRIGAIAWNVTQRHVQTVLLLSDQAIRDAQLWMWQELRLAVEPAAALPLAALQSGAYRPRADDKVCLIICGANIDPSTLV